MMTGGISSTPALSAGLLLSAQHHSLSAQPLSTRLHGARKTIGVGGMERRRGRGKKWQWGFRWEGAGHK